MILGGTDDDGCKEEANRNGELIRTNYRTPDPFRGCLRLIKWNCKCQLGVY